MIRRFICATFFGHDWRRLYLPRYYDEKHEGAMDCLRCQTVKRIRRDKPVALLRELVSAIDAIEQGHTVDKAERLQAALCSASSYLDFVPFSPSQKEGTP